MIKISIAPLSESQGFIRALSALDNPILALIFGVAFTALLQSSSSSVVIFQTFVVQGLLSYDTAVYLVIGAAIGSVTPNLLAGMTTNRDGKRTAILNLVFNLFRACLLLIIINVFPRFLELIKSLSPADVGRQVANTHTIFAIIAVIFGFPLMNLFVMIAKKILPDLPEEKRMKEEKRLIYMVNTESVLPAMAVKLGIMETLRMGKMAVGNLETAMDYFHSGLDAMARRIVQTEECVDDLTKAISDQLISLRSKNIAGREAYVVSKLLLVLSSFERIGDYAENIMEYRQRLQDAHTEISGEALQEINHLCELTRKSVAACVKVFELEDSSYMAEAELREQAVDDFTKEIINNHAERLMQNKCQAIPGIVFVDLCTDLERCSDHAMNIAEALLEE